MSEMMSSSHIPQISVVMAIYKEPEEWMRLSIDSILEQTFTDFELIIVNDNPQRTENIELINEYLAKDSRIIVINNDVNIGLTKSLNKALKVSKGKYIARMDADDIAMPERLRIQYDILLSSNADVCWSAFAVIDEKNKEINPYKNNPNLSQLVIYNMIAHPTVLFCRNLLSFRERFYNELYKRAQDYELWTFLNSVGVKFVNVPNVLLLYRQSTSQVTRIRQDEQLSSFKEMRRIYISTLLRKVGIYFNPNNISETLYELNKYISKCCSVDKYILNIRFLLYINIVSDRPMLILQYLFKYKLYSDLNSHMKIMLVTAFNPKHYSLFEL